MQRLTPNIGTFGRTELPAALAARRPGASSNLCRKSSPNCVFRPALMLDAVQPGRLLFSGPCGVAGGRIPVLKGISQRSTSHVTHWEGRHMSSIGFTNDGPVGLRARIESSGWIHSPLFDGAFLILVPLLTLPIIVGIYFRIPLLAITAGVMLAFAHYFSTVSFYFWQENREYHRARWVAFFAGPVIIV